MAVFFPGVFFHGTFSSVSSSPTCLFSPPPLKTIGNGKALGGGRRALTIPLPQMRSTTQTGATLNTNAPNLPQLLKVPAVSLWWRGIRSPTETLRRKSRERASTAGLHTVRRLPGKNRLKCSAGEDAHTLHEGYIFIFISFPTDSDISLLTVYICFKQELQMEMWRLILISVLVSFSTLNIVKHNTTFASWKQSKSFFYLITAVF